MGPGRAVGGGPGNPDLRRRHPPPPVARLRAGGGPGSGIPSAGPSGASTAAHRRQPGGCPDGRAGEDRSGGGPPSRPTAPLAGRSLRRQRVRNCPKPQGGGSRHPGQPAARPSPPSPAAQGPPLRAGPLRLRASAGRSAWSCPGCCCWEASPPAALPDRSGIAPAWARAAVTLASTWNDWGSPGRRSRSISALRASPPWAF